MSETIKICITGAAGQIGYSLVPMIDLPFCMEFLNGFVMELIDSAYPLVEKYIPTSDQAEGFKDADYCVLVGAFPRKKDQTRADLLKINGKIFKAQGETISNNSKKTAKIVVVGNPANTNALVLSQFAKNIPKKNITCLTRLDVNRAKAQVAGKLNIYTSQVKNVVVWGNHSASQVPDVSNGYILEKGVKKPIKEAITDSEWLKNDFAKCVKTRGKAVIEKRGKSSATSAAKAICDHMRNWTSGSDGEITSMGIYTDKSYYGIEKGLVCSFPLICKGGDYEVVENLTVDDEIKKLIKLSEDELKSERKSSFEMLGIK